MRERKIVDEGVRTLDASTDVFMYECRQLHMNLSSSPILFYCAWTRPYYENITEYNNTTAEEKEQPPIYGRLRHERLNEALKTPYIASNKGHGREENV
jgi:hypothetical protein